MHTNVFARLKQVQIIEVLDRRGPDNQAENNTGVSIAGSSGGGNQMFQCFSTILHVHLEILSRGNQPQGWEIPVLLIL